MVGWEISAGRRYNEERERANRRNEGTRRTIEAAKEERKSGIVTLRIVFRVAATLWRLVEGECGIFQDYRSYGIKYMRRS